MTASYDGTARVWDVKGRQLAIYKGSRAAFSPNGQRVATVVDGRVKVYDIQTLPELVDWGCQWLHNYLEYGQSTDAERELCGLPPRNPEAAQSTRRESVFSSVVNWMREAWEPFS
jgi:WD40 repeat protein